MRRIAIVSAASLLSGLCAVVGGSLLAAPAGALDAGCSALGGVEAAGVCNVSVTSTPGANVTVNSGLNLHLLNGAHIKPTVAGFVLTVSSGSLEMDKGSSIDGANKSMTINVPNGNMLMHGTTGPTDKCYANGTAPNAPPSNALGAQITSVQALVTTTITINVGDILANPPTGSFQMERCSVVSVNSTGSAGQIVINAGHDVDVDGIVMSEGGMSGQSPNQPTGGGTVTIKTSCSLEVSATGVVSSKGRDPGADLVHLEGCDVDINGLVQSTGPGHTIPHNGATLLNHCDIHPHAVGNTDTGCIEVWAEELTISNTGEVNADVNSTGSGGPQGTSYIDLFADKELKVTGRTAANSVFSVHADSKSGTDTTPNTITVLSHTSSLTASGRAFSASSTGNGSFGGTVDLEASTAVNLNTATVNAVGSNSGSGSPTPPCSGGAGACGAGGHIIVRSWTSTVTWQNGVGNVSPDLFGGVAPHVSGRIELTACTPPIDTTGTNFGPNAATSVTKTTGTCVAGPALPAYVETAFSGPTGDRVIWDHCGSQPGPGSKSGMKFNDLNGNHAKDAGEPAIAGWTIRLFGAGDVEVPLVSPTTTDASGNYAFNGLPPGTYKACEDVPAGWVQSYPQAATVPPAGETIVTCPNGTQGYQFTNVDGNIFTGNDFGNFQQGSVLVRKKTVDGVGSFTFNLTNQAGGTRTIDTTGQQGVFVPASQSWSGLAPGSYTISENNPGSTWIVGTFSCNYAGSIVGPIVGASPTIVLQSGQVWTCDIVNTKILPGSKSGMKFNDLNGNHVKDAGEPAIPGWTVRLFGAGDVEVPIVSPTTTDASGNYGFATLTPGTYKACEDLPSGWVQTYPQAATTPPAGETIVTCPNGTLGYQFTVVSGNTFTGNNFGNFQQGSVLVRKKSVDGVGSFTFNLTNQAGGTRTIDTTGQQGVFVPASQSWSGLAPGSYTISENNPGSTWTVGTFSCNYAGSIVGPIVGASPTIVLQSGQVWTCDIVNTKILPGSKSGMKFNDLNGNHLKDAGEPAIPGWTVRLFDLSNLEVPVVSPTTTDASGNYSFTGLTPGTYKACEDLPSGWVQTYPQAATVPPAGETVISCMNGTKGYQFTIVSGNAFTGNDFGNFQKGSVLVRKKSVGGTGSFTFTLTNQSGGTRTIDTTGQEGVFVPASSSWSGLAPGSYKISENNPGATWTVGTFSCNYAGSIVAPIVGASPTIVLQSGQVWTCDIVNTKVPPAGGTETAFAMGTHGEATCFLDIPALNNNRWGWTNGPLAQGTYTFELWAGAGQCDTSKGTLVGNVVVVYTGSTVTVTFNTTGGHTFNEAHVFVGTDILPKKNGSYTVAPGQYPQGSTFAATTTKTFTFTGVSGNIFVVAHAITS